MIQLPRPYRVTAGAIGLLLLLSVAYLGYEIANGALREDYTVDIVLGELGQNLSRGNDVKIRGVRVGHIQDVNLDENHNAVVTVLMEPGFRVPRESTFHVTGKTLLGEKQVEIRFDGPYDEGPFLALGEVVDDAERVVEFEDVLATFAELFEAIDPVDLAVVVDELVAAWEGMGPEVARSIDEGARAAERFRASLDDQVAVNENLALVAEELAIRGQDFNRLGRAVEQGMPTISENQAEVRALLDELAAFSRVVDTTLRGTRPELDRMMIQGDTVLRLFFRYRVAFGDIFPTGLVEYSGAFRDDTGFHDPNIDGLAAYFQLIIDQSGELEELCDNLPPELASGMPGCGESTVTDPQLPLLPDLPDIPPGSGSSGTETGQDTFEDDLLRELPAPLPMQRSSADVLVRNAIAGPTAETQEGER